MKSVFLALAPGLACALLGFVVEGGPYLVKNVKAFMQRRASVDNLRDVVKDIANVGSAVGGLLGYKENSPETFIAAAAWYLIFLRLSFALAFRVHELEQESDERRPRRRNRRA